MALFRSAAVSALCALLALPAMAEGDLRQLVATVVQNELKAQATDQYWVFRDSNRKGKKTVVTRVVETSECHFSWPLLINGKPPAGDDKEKAKQNLQALVTSADARAKNKKEIQEDTDKANALMKLLPDAFLFAHAGQQKQILRVRFRPNPNYKPPTNEAKVFHKMAGYLLIDMREKRLAKMSGKLTEDVDFGLGILGKLRKGGTFTVVQTDVGSGDWEISLLDVHISGRALFFHQIGEQQHEVMTSFKPVPRDISLQKAASLAENGQ